LKFATWAVDALVGVYIIKLALDATQHWNVALLEKYIWIFVIYLPIYICIAYSIRKIDWPYLYHDLEKYIYRKYIPKIITLDNNYVESLGTGKLLSIFTTGRTQWVESSTMLLQQVAKIVLTWGFMLWLIFMTSIVYGVVVIVWLIVLHGIVVWLDSFARKYRQIRRDEKPELTRKLVRVIMSRNELIQNEWVKNSLQGIMESTDIIANANNLINRTLFIIFNLLRVFTGWIRIFALVVVWYGVIDWIFTLAEFASILAMVIVFENFLGQSTDFYKNFTKDFCDIEKLWEVLDDGPVMKWYDSGLPFSPQKKDINIDSISYGYNETNVFSDFSLTIKRWHKTALVGASGGGKTTLMKLIAGYLHPESGYISVLGNQLDETALKTYYPHIGYLTQDPGVFDATIRENLVSAVSSVPSVSLSSRRDLFQNQIWESDNQNLLSAWKRDSSVALRNDKKEQENKKTTDTILEQKLIKALKLAHCDFVFELEHGLDTEIGERGVRLSWGQKQRLAIAKIFLKDPEIILLDEPTSALDSFSEEAITVVLDELFKDRTVIIVAHRLQTVRKADDILVLEWGQVVERGTHTELVEKWGIYNRMLELQSGF
jgi:ABC-type multidrug transport system fused ATPase/permease subunit